MSIGLHVKYPLFLLEFNKTWIFSTDFGEIRVPNFMKIRSVGAELFHADRHTGRNDIANSRSLQFCESA
jgi:hypothetical protein